MQSWNAQTEPSILFFPGQRVDCPLPVSSPCSVNSWIHVVTSDGPYARSQLIQLRAFHAPRHLLSALISYSHSIDSPHRSKLLCYMEILSGEHCKDSKFVDRRLSHQSVMRIDSTAAAFSALCCYFGCFKFLSFQTKQSCDKIY